MLTKKKKLSKKEIQEDKLVTSYYKAQELFEEYQKQIMVAAGVLAAIVIVIIFFVNRAETRNLEASAELARVLPIYDSGSFKESIEGRAGTNIIGLERIVNEYSGSEKGEIAKIYLGNAHYYSGNFDLAKEYYSDYSGSLPLFKAAAKAGLAGCYEAEGNFEEAADAYRNAAKVFEFNALNPYYLLNAGINYHKAGLKDKALESLEVVTTDYGMSQFYRDAMKWIEIAKM